MYEYSFSLFGALGILTLDTIPIVNLDIIRGKTNRFLVSVNLSNICQILGQGFS